MTLEQMLVEEATYKGFRAMELDSVITIWLLSRKVYRSEIVEALDLHEHEMFVIQRQNAVQIDLS